MVAPGIVALSRALGDLVNILNEQWIGVCGHQRNTTALINHWLSIGLGDREYPGIIDQCVHDMKTVNGSERLAEICRVMVALSAMSSKAFSLGKMFNKCRSIVENIVARHAAVRGKRREPEKTFNSDGRSRA